MGWFLLFIHFTLESEISKGKSVVTLVPTGVELLTVFDVDPSDISKLIPDTSVKIQLNALPAQKHGELKGKLIYVSL